MTSSLDDANLIAHEDREGRFPPHRLGKHLEDTAKQAGRLMPAYDPIGFIPLAAITHDIGKGRPDVQRYLHDPNGKRGSVKHALPGAYVLSLSRESLPATHHMLAYLLENVVAGHHRGLYDLNRSFLEKYDPSLSADDFPDEIKRFAAEQVAKLADVPIPPHWDALYYAALTRFALSAVVDADWLDTERYFNQEELPTPSYEAPSWEHFQQLFHHRMNNLSREDLSTYRRQAEQNGAVPGSYFELNLPTGFGKTFASLAFALEHARTFNKSRIIVALPLINLTTELSAIYRDYFGLEHVIEDHSAIPTSPEESEEESQNTLRIARENWDLPFILTTSVNLFESLFSNHPSKLRKIHRLAGSVLILEEFHLIPPSLLAPILRLLDTLQDYFGVTVLLVSATPYPLVRSNPIQKLGLRHQPAVITEPVKPPKRVTFHQLGVLDEERLADQVKEGPTLIIVNTRKRAQQLYKLLAVNNPNRPVFHLSTTLSAIDRKYRLDAIKGSMKQRPLVIATSVLEAGVDLSFDHVFREIAPLPSIVQAAGRCNRYEELDSGHVYLFEWTDPVYPPGSFEAGVRHVQWLLTKYGEDALYSAKAMDSYYLRLLSQYADASPIDETEVLLFETVAKKFQMIESHGQTVICPQTEGFQEIWLQEPKNRAWWRKIQPYTAQAPDNVRGITQEHDVPVWKGDYDKDLGIVLP